MKKRSLGRSASYKNKLRHLKFSTHKLENETDSLGIIRRQQFQAKKGRTCSVLKEKWKMNHNRMITNESFVLMS